MSHPHRSSRSSRFLLCAAVTFALPVVACQDATEIDIEVSTSARCSDLGSTSVTVGRRGEIEAKDPATVSSSCESPGGAIGSVVVTPSDDGDELGFKVVTGVKKQASQCTPPAYQGCIVARRSLRFVPRKKTTVRITMDIACLDVPCEALDTCKNGSCVPASCEGEACNDPPPVACPSSACTTEGEAICVSGKSSAICRRDASGCLAPEPSPCAGTRACDAGACTCPKDACTIGALTCASAATFAACVDDGAGCGVLGGTTPCASAAQTCTNGVCACPTSACVAGVERCSTDGRSAEACVVDAAGCTTLATAESCGDGATCAVASGVARCVCNTSTCSSAGPSCVDAAHARVCALDAQGCLYEASKITCAFPATCAVSRCGCASGNDCALGAACVDGLCVADVVGPTLVSATATGAREVRVTYSEPVSVAAANPASYCVEIDDGDTSSCTATGDFAVAAVAQVDSQTFVLALSADAHAKTYTVHADGTIADLTGNPIGAPRAASFVGPSDLRVVAATALSTSSIEVVFDRAVRMGPDSAGSAGCASVTTCASRFALAGPSSLGAITSGVVQDAPNDNRVILTHASPQRGGNYTLLVANARNGDGFDNGATTIAAPTPGTVGAAPLDRSTFAALGVAVGTSFGDGPIFADPFGDGLPFTTVFSHLGKLHIGPSKNGRNALRFDPDGASPEMLGFSFPRDATGSRVSRNTSPPPYPSIGFPGCAINSAECGTDNERGVASFVSVDVGGTQVLAIAGAGTTADSVERVYVTRDAGTALNWQFLDADIIPGGFLAASTLGSVAGHLYVSGPTTGGKRPMFGAFHRLPPEGAPGLDAQSAGVNDAPCDPAVHDACWLDANRMPSVGEKGSPKNAEKTQAMDFIGAFNGFVYTGNNGGLVRGTVPAPRNYGVFPTDWLPISPTASSYTAKTSVTLAKERDIHPADRAWPMSAVFNGHLFIARNTTTGPQLWRCDPARTSVTDQCDPGDWSLVAPNAHGDRDLTQFNHGGNARLSMLIVNGGFLYIGFDNASGVRVYRTSDSDPSSPSDFTGLAGCSGSSSPCAGLGGNGFGVPANRQIFASSSVSHGGSTYLTCAVGDGVSPVKIYRQRD